MTNLESLMLHALRLGAAGKADDCVLLTRRVGRMVKRAPRGEYCPDFVEDMAELVASLPMPPLHAILRMEPAATPPTTETPT